MALALLINTLTLSAQHRAEDSNHSQTILHASYCQYKRYDSLGEHLLFVSAREKDTQRLNICQWAQCHDYI